MAKSDVETSRIYDGVRGSKIHLDISSKLNQWSDTLLPGSIQASTEQRHHRKLDVRHVERDFARLTVDEVSRRIIYQSYNEIETNKRFDFNSNFDESVCGFYSCKVMEDPFHGFYRRHGGLIYKFKKNLLDFDGFWHPEGLMSWIDAIEDFFEEINPPEHVKCKIVWYKMKGAAYYWWKQIQREKNEHGEEEITSWSLMKNLLLNRFLPTKCLTECPNHDKRDELYCSMSDTQIPANVTLVKPIGEAMNYISLGARNYQQQSGGYSGKEYGYGTCDGADFEAAHAKDPINQDTIHEFEKIKKDSEDIKGTVAFVEGCEGERDDVQIIDEEEDFDKGRSKENEEESVKVTPVASQFPILETSIQEKPSMMVFQDVVSCKYIDNSSQLLVIADLEDSYQQEYGIGTHQTNSKYVRKKTLSRCPYLTSGHLAGHEDQLEVKEVKLLIGPITDTSTILDYSKNSICLNYGRYKVSCNSVLELALFLFDPGGIFCLPRVLSAKLLAGIISFENALTIVRYYEWSEEIMIKIVNGDKVYLCKLLDGLVVVIMFFVCDVKNSGNEAACKVVSIKELMAFGILLVIQRSCDDVADLLMDKIAMRIVFCSFVWLGNSCDCLAYFLIVISVMLYGRISGRFLIDYFFQVNMGALWLHAVCNVKYLAHFLCRSGLFLHWTIEGNLLLLDQDLEMSALFGAPKQIVIESWRDWTSLRSWDPGKTIGGDLYTKITDFVRRVGRILLRVGQTMSKEMDTTLALTEPILDVVLAQSYDHVYRARPDGDRWLGSWVKVGKWESVLLLIVYYLLRNLIIAEASLLKVSKLIVPNESSIIYSNAEIGILGQGALNFSGLEDIIDVLRLVSLFSYGICGMSSSSLQDFLHNASLYDLIPKSIGNQEKCSLELRQPPVDYHIEDVNIDGLVIGSIVCFHMASSSCGHLFGVKSTFGLGCTHDWKKVEETGVMHEILICMVDWTVFCELFDEYNPSLEGKFIVSKLSVVTTSSCLSILCRDGNLKKTLKLFHKLVNGLDPPKISWQALVMLQVCQMSKTFKYVELYLINHWMTHELNKNNSRMSFRFVWGGMELM